MTASLEGANSTIKYYVNGIEVSSSDQPTFTDLLGNTVDSGSVGTNTMIVDDFYIWDRVVTPEEIATLAEVSPTATPTSTNTNTPTITQTPTITNTLTKTPTMTFTPTISFTRTPLPNISRWLPTSVPNLNLRNTPTPRPFKNPWARTR